MSFRFEKIEEEKSEEIRPLQERRSLLGAIEAAEKQGRTPVIAEVKKASPSRGALRDIEPADAALAMERGGACAISVLTDRNFDGKVCYLRQVKQAVKTPVLRKDFIIDPFQLYESRGNGADAVLLIASLLGERTKDYVKEANKMGLEALVEVHTAADLEHALETDARLIGINNRDLSTLKVDLTTTERLAPLIQKGRMIISESGIETREDIERLRRAGARAFLIGTGIMLSEDIEKKARGLSRR